ncbi:3D domain-containing protein [Vaginisenegalia massiliensis]|uniref:3D domain-containing protein n=1 Tax=Vaginisenegalia massiliensis TaxID=2058294 RepID=UPI000F53ED47|nr:3D domain-containing protein [Vaginisenegalia massiliensis]
MNKSLKLMTSAALLLSSMPLASLPAVQAQESHTSVWVARSVEEILSAMKAGAYGQDKAYEVQWGDTLSSIAEAINIPLADLAAINNIDNVDMIMAGSVLYFDAQNKTLTYAQPQGNVVTVSTDNGQIVDNSMNAQEVYAKVDQKLAEETTAAATAVVEATPEWVAPETTTVNETSSQTAESSSESQASQTEVASETSSESQESITQVETSQAPTTEVTTEPTTEVTTEATTQAPAETTSAEATQGRAVQVEATAYSYNQPELSTMTASGIDLSQNPNVIAVDPSVIPLGSTVYIPGYGTFIAGDTGGAIVGNRIDIHMTDLSAAMAFGRQSLTVYVQ